MKKILLISASTLLASGVASAQSAMDAYLLSQPDLKGTARFMSMGGAFGALGGDLTTLSQNPGGIGVYRNTEIGFTLDIDCQSSTAQSLGASVGDKHTKVLLNNIGGVATWKLASPVLPNINFGFTYNKASSFNRRFKGNVPSLNTSMSNYIAALANGDKATIGDLSSTNHYDPYNPDDGGFTAPWIDILGYDSYLIGPQACSPGDPDHIVNPDDSSDIYKWVGQFGNGTKGSGYFDSYTHGGVDEYNLAFGGNISNVVFWGMDFGIIDTNVTQETNWGESLDNAYVQDDKGNVYNTSAETNLYNYYHLSATGFNYKLGVIVKPIQELRLGFAFHTPTWYQVDEAFYGEVNYQYGAETGIPKNWACTNNGKDGLNNYNLTTPWRLIFSAAGVIGSRFIISADYEWAAYNGMKYSVPGSYWAWNSSNPFEDVNGDIKNYYRQTNTLRVGAEFRVTPQLSVRAGYSYVSSPVRPKAADGSEVIYTAGTRLSYLFDNTTNYVTCGLGYRYKKFYVDAAYVYKTMKSTYHAFASPIDDPTLSPSAEVKTDRSQIVLSMGFKF